MSDHLPECDLAKLCPHNPAHDLIKENPFAEPFCYHCDAQCECLRLRACEKRVLNLNPVALGVLIAQRARERALGEAREAVAEWIDKRRSHDFRTCDDRDHDCYLFRDALAAIDALRGEA